MAKKLNINKVAMGLYNDNYADNIEATKQLMDLFDSIVKKGSKYKLENEDDYIRMYEDHCYTYQTWTALVETETEYDEGLTEDILRRELEDTNGTVYKLPCGWYIRYI